MIAYRCVNCGSYDLVLPAQCAVCGSYGFAQVEKGSTQWQRDMQHLSSKGPCNLAGTLDSAQNSLKQSQKILELLDQVTALHLKCVGISYGQSVSTDYFMHTQDGSSGQEKLAAKASATFVNLQSTLFNLFTLVKIAEDNLIINLKELDSNTGGPTKTP